VAENLLCKHKDLILKLCTTKIQKNEENDDRQLLNMLISQLDEIVTEFIIEHLKKTFLMNVMNTPQDSTFHAIICILNNANI
jgi:hypothetical protein